MSKQKKTKEKAPVVHWCRTHNQEAKTPFGDGFVCPSAYMGAGPCRVVQRRPAGKKPTR